MTKGSHRPVPAMALLVAVLLWTVLWDGAAAAPPQRVVSLVPSLTEVMGALGARDLLVGRSRYCLRPPSVRTLPEVGGYLDPSWEALLGLRPDLVLITPESRETARRLEQLRLPCLAIPQNRLPDVLEGMARLGEAVGRPREGRRLADSLRAGLERLARPARDGPRVLLVAGRSPEAGMPRDLWVIGRGSWLSDLLAAVGARNVVDDLRPSLPALSREGVLALDPDWIIELWPEEPRLREPSSLEADWRAWPELRAVTGGRVRALRDDRLIVPGPRVVEAARILRALLDESR